MRSWTSWIQPKRNRIAKALGQLGMYQVCAAIAREGSFMKPAIRALGLMSGTSMDGIDIALIETDGERVNDRGRALKPRSRPWS